jgi:hypothetical protein
VRRQSENGRNIKVNARGYVHGLPGSVVFGEKRLRKVRIAHHDIGEGLQGGPWQVSIDAT